MKGAEDVVAVLTASELARWLRIPKSTLYKLCQEGHIPATKIGRRWRFQRSLIDDWLKKQDHTRAGGHLMRRTSPSDLTAPRSDARRRA